MWRAAEQFASAIPALRCLHLTDSCCYRESRRSLCASNATSKTPARLPNSCGLIPWSSGSTTQVSRTIRYIRWRNDTWVRIAARSLPGVKGGFEAGTKCFNAFGLFKRMVNMGDAKSLSCHPASTTHRQLTPEEQEKVGVKPEMIRLSVGIEHIDDILEDLGQALESAR